MTIAKKLHLGGKEIEKKSDQEGIKWQRNHTREGIK